MLRPLVDFGLTGPSGHVPNVNDVVDHEPPTEEIEHINLREQSRRCALGCQVEMLPIDHDGTVSGMTPEPYRIIVGGHPVCSERCYQRIVKGGGCAGGALGGCWGCGKDLRG